MLLPLLTELLYEKPELNLTLNSIHIWHNKFILSNKIFNVCKCAYKGWFILCSTAPSLFKSFLFFGTHYEIYIMLSKYICIMYWTNHIIWIYIWFIHGSSSSLDMVMLLSNQFNKMFYFFFVCCFYYVSMYNHSFKLDKPCEKNNKNLLCFKPN